MNENATSVEIMVVADDRRGGIAFGKFQIIVQDIPPSKISLLALLIVAALIFAFIVGTIVVLCLKNTKCC